MIVRPCRWSGCNKLTDRRDGFCDDHARQYNRERLRQYPTSTQRGYTAEWREIRRRKLATQPFCELCESAGRVTLATEVHHADRDQGNNSMSNLVSICKRCHMIEHNGDRFKRKVKTNDQ